jgi:hypothetical protein
MPLGDANRAGVAQPAENSLKGCHRLDAACNFYLLAVFCCLRRTVFAARKAEVWSYEREDGKRRFFAIRHVGGITGPREAVRAILAEAGRKQ